MGLSSNDSVRLQEELEALKNQKIGKFAIQIQNIKKEEYCCLIYFLYNLYNILTILHKGQPIARKKSLRLVLYTIFSNIMI